MKYYYTGLQILKDGTEIGIPLVAYSSTNEYIARYHQEMAAAALNTNVASVVTFVFDSSGCAVFNNTWVRQYDPAEYEETTEATE